MLRKIKLFRNLIPFSELLTRTGTLCVLPKHYVPSSGAGFSNRWLFIVAVLGIVSFHLPMHAAASGNCSDPIIVDLTHDADATWTVSSPVTPDGACCGMPNNFNCFELLIYLHEDATSFSIDFTTATGQLQYMIDCENVTPVPSPPDPRVIHFCQDNPDNPVSVTFCRPGSATYEFEVSSFQFGIDVVSLDPIDPVCLDDPPFELTGGYPAGGEYFINNSSSPSTHFDPGLYGGGIHTIQYVYENGCTSLAETTVTVYPLPDLQCHDIEVCQGSGEIILADLFPDLPSPATFLHGGNPVTTFNPDTPGDFTFEYVYNPYNLHCPSSCTFSIIVNPTPVITWDSPPELCDDSGLISLNGLSPAGGVYSGDFVENHNTFNTDDASPGNYTLTYTYTDQNGCSASSTNQLVMHPSPQAEAGDPLLAEMCGTVELSGTASGGTGDYGYLWNPSAMVEDHENASTTTVPVGGTTHFYFTVTDQKGCSSTDDLVVVVEDGTTVQLEPFDDMCLNEPFVELAGGSPAGGSFYINDQTSSSGFFIPADHGPGLHTITYVYTNLNGCTSSATQTLLVHPLPQITWEGMEFCNYPGMVPLEGALPEGGIYGGNHVVDNEFNIQNAGAGNFIVNYTYTDENGCSSSAVANIAVHELPIANAGDDQQNLPVGESTTLEALDGGTGSYLYQWEPAVFLNEATGQQVDTRPLVFAQSFDLTVTDQQTGCLATDQMIVNITGGEVDISDIIYAPTICEGETTQIEVIPSGGMPPYEYLWYKDVAPWDDPAVVHFNADTGNPLVEVSPAEGTHDYFLVMTDANGEEAYGTIQMIVSPLPDVTLTDFVPVCANNPEYSFNGAGLPEGGNYHFVNSFGQQIPPPYDPYPYFNPADIGEGGYTLVYEYTDLNGCTASASKDFEILPFVKAEFFVSKPDRCNSKEVLIQNNSSGATSYTWDFDDNSYIPPNIDDPEFSYIYPHHELEQHYTLQLIAEHALCPDTTERTVTVVPQAKAGISFHVVDDRCAPMDVQFINESTGEVLHYFLHFGDGALNFAEDFQLPVEKTYTNFSPVDSIYTARLIIASQNYYCTDVDSVDILVYPQVEPGFTLDPSAHCTPYDAVVENTALHAENWYWSLGDGTDLSHTAADSITTLNHLYENPGTDPDTLTIEQTVWIERESEQKCIRNAAAELVVFPDVIAEIDTDKTPLAGDTIIEGCAPFTVDFSSSSSKNAHHFLWDFDDGGSSSQQNPTHTFENSGADPVLYKVDMKASSDYQCADNAHIYVRVLPEITASFAFTPQIVCSPQSVIFNNNSTTNALVEYAWDFDNGEVSLNENPESAFENNGSVPETYEVELIATTVHGCSDSLVRPITVNPHVEANISSDPAPSAGDGFVESCAPFTVNFSSGTSLNAHDFLWDFDENDASSSQADHSWTFDEPGTFEVILSADSEYACYDHDTLTVVVHPTPKTSFALEQESGCSPLQSAINYQFTPEAGVAYSWDINGDGNVEVFDPNDLPVDFELENSGDQPLNFTLHLQATNDKNCTSEFSREVTVYPVVSAMIETFPAADDPTPGVLQACGPFEIDFNASSSKNAHVFLWDFGDGLSSSLVDPTHTFFQFSHETEETFDVSLYAASSYGCLDMDTFQVTVSPVPLADFTVDAPVGCSPHSVNFINSSIGADSFQWDMGNGEVSNEINPSLEYFVDDQSTTYQVELEVSNNQGCSDSFTQEVEVYPAITASFDVDITEGCHPLTVVFTNHSTGDETLMDFEWDYGDGNTSTTKEDVHTHIFNNESYYQDTIYTVVLTANYAGVCIDTHEVDVLVKARPQPYFSVPNSPSCPPAEMQIVNMSQGVDQYSWDFGDGNVSDLSADTLYHLYVVPAGNLPDEYTIQLDVTASNGCTHTYTHDVIVFPDVRADFSMNISEGCSPLEVVFEDASTGALNYFWDYGDETYSENTSLQHAKTFTNQDAEADQFYDVKLYTESAWGCVDTVVHQVRVYPQPVANFDYDVPGGCSPVDINFSNLSQGASSYTWDFGDTTQSNEVDPSHTFLVYGELVETLFQVELMAGNDQGCTDSFVQQINVYPDLTALFTADKQEGCHPLTVEFTNNTLGDKDFIYYSWNYGDGNGSEDTDLKHSHVFRNYSHTKDTVYTVQLTAMYADVCFDVYEMDILVKASPKADFVLPNNPGCAPHDLIIENHSQGAVEYIWDYGDGSEASDFSGDSFTHFYTQSVSEGMGTYPITLDVVGENGCTHSFQQNAIIYPEVEADFAMDNHEGCNPLRVQFDNMSAGASQFDWKFGYGFNVQSEEPIHTFYNYSHHEIAVQTVSLTAVSEFGCTAEYTDTIRIWPGPNTQFVTSETQGCAPFTTEIFNTSEQAISYQWDYGDGVVSEEENAQISYTWDNQNDYVMNYHVLLTAWNDFGCASESFENIIVYPNVEADFVAKDDIYADCSPFGVRFLNQSHLGHTSFWDFGDGGESTSGNPFHLFENPGNEIITYDVLLEVSSIFGCTDTSSTQITVYPTPDARFSAQPQKQPYPNTTVAIENLTGNGEWYYSWDFGDGNTSEETNTVFEHTYIWDEGDLETKEYTVTLNAVNEYCADTTQKQVVITSPVPEAEYDGTLQGCAPLAVNLQNESLHSDHYRWEFGDGAISYEESPQHIYHEAGIYQLKLIARGDGGTDSLIYNVEVYENPVAQFELVNKLIHMPLEPLQVINNSELGAFYFWEFGDGNSSYDFEPEHFYTEKGVYDISLTVYTDTEPQCQDVMELKNGLRVEETCQMVFPNAFKPSTSGSNGGVYDLNNIDNKVFHPVYQGIDEYELEIFTRWGEFIFQSSDPDVGWDGYVRDKLAPMGVYVYKVKARCSTGRLMEKSGDVTLIR